MIKYFGNVQRKSKLSRAYCKRLQVLVDLTDKFFVMVQKLWVLNLADMGEERIWLPSHYLLKIKKKNIAISNQL